MDDYNNIIVPASFAAISYFGHEKFNNINHVGLMLLVLSVLYDIKHTKDPVTYFPNAILAGEWLLTSIIFDMVVMLSSSSVIITIIRIITIVVLQIMMSSGKFEHYLPMVVILYYIIIPRRKYNITSQPLLPIIATTIRILFGGRHTLSLEDQFTHEYLFNNYIRYVLFLLIIYK